MECMELKFCMSDKHHRYYKHTKFRQNPRGDPKFLVDLTWNDPYARKRTHYNESDDSNRYLVVISNLKHKCGFEVLKFKC